MWHNKRANSGIKSLTLNVILCNTDWTPWYSVINFLWSLVETMFSCHFFVFFTNHTARTELRPFSRLCTVCSNAVVLRLSTKMNRDVNTNKRALTRLRWMWSKWLWHSFPSLLGLFSCFQEELCTEGENLAYTFWHRETGVEEEAIAFSQYPRPADTPQVPETGVFRKANEKAFMSCLKFKLWVFCQLAGIFV